MKESRFIAQNKEKWREAETLLQSSVKDPEKLSNLFVQVVDDLSYSRTYYGNRSVRVYLNKIARQFFSIIYSHRKEKHNRFLLFWTDELPQVVVHARKPMLLSLVVFLLAAAIGVFSSYNDPEFAQNILGKDYVTMTNQNIEANDPMKVYKESHQVDMFLGITLNNLMVAFRTYALGIFLGIGTIGSLLQNGIMVGCFQYFFVPRGLLFESALTIWLHGTLEISAIILAGGAGFTLASGLIFPGTYSRLQSLQISGIRSLKLMLGIAPVFVLAGIIESFLTRYTDAPVYLRLALIILSATFIIGYFAVYPWLKNRQGFQVPLKDIRLAPSVGEPVNFHRIKSNAEIMKDAFQLYFRVSKTIISCSAIVSIGVAGARYFLVPDVPFSIVANDLSWLADIFPGLTDALETPEPLFIFINALATSIVLYRVMMVIDADSKKIVPKISIKHFLQLFILLAVLYTGIWLGTLGSLAVIVVFGFVLFVGFVQLTERAGVFYSLSAGWEMFLNNKNQGLGLQFALLFMAAVFLLVLSAPLFYIQMSVLKWNFVSQDPLSIQIVRCIELFLKTFSFYLVVPIVAAGIAYLYFSQEEATNAGHLKESIAKMGAKPSKK